MKKYQRPLWFIAAVAGLLLVPTWFYWGFLENVYVGRPREPHPEIGLTEAHEVKGITVYVTTREREIVTWLFRIDIGLFAVIFLCAALSGGTLGKHPPKSN
jgi:hypothetical protein